MEANENVIIHKSLANDATNKRQKLSEQLKHTGNNNQYPNSSGKDIGAMIDAKIFQMLLGSPASNTTVNSLSSATSVGGVSSLEDMESSSEKIEKHLTELLSTTDISDISIKCKLSDIDSKKLEEITLPVLINSFAVNSKV